MIQICSGQSGRQKGGYSVLRDISLTALERTASAVSVSASLVNGGLLTNSSHRKNHTVRSLVLRSSKKLNIFHSFLLAFSNCSCKSRRGSASYSTSCRRHGLDPSGCNARAARLPKALKLEPRWGVPKKTTPIVCSVMWASDWSWLARVSACCS